MYNGLMRTYLRSPDDGAGGGGAEDTITMTKTEKDALTLQFYQNGLREGKDRAKKDIPELFVKHGLTYTDDLDKTLAGMAETIKNGSTNADERVKALEVQVSALSKSVEEHKNAAASSLADRDNYIINSQIVSSASRQNAVQPEDIAHLLRNGMKIQNTHDGIRVYKSNGEIWYNDSGQPLNVEEAVTTFLSSRPHYVKQQSSGGEGGQEKTGTTSDLIAKAEKDPMSLTPEERANALKAL